MKVSQSNGRFNGRECRPDTLGHCISCRHFRRGITEFVEHYHLEGNHQGLDNRLIEGDAPRGRIGPIGRRSRLGGLLNYYERAA